MRSVLTISLPKNEAATVQRNAAVRGFKSVSAYMRFLCALDRDDDRISTKELLAMTQRAEDDYTRGRLRKGRSMRALLA